MKSFKIIFYCIFAYGSQFEIDTRENAITKAISIASPAVASISTQVQRFVVNPYFDDPSSIYFSPEIRQREVKGSGSGVVISPDGYVITNVMLWKMLIKLLLHYLVEQNMMLKLLGLITLQSCFT